MSKDEVGQGGRVVTPADLRALAARVVAEEPSRELDADIWDALGLTYAAELAAKDWMRRHGNRPRRDYLLAWSPAFTISHDAAVAAMPAGWSFIIRVQDDGWSSVSAAKGDRVVKEGAPDFPRALTAAGLMARAAEDET